jgi:PKD repeat protein
MTRLVCRLDGWGRRLVALTGTAAVVAVSLVVVSPGPADAAPPTVDLGPNLTLEEGEGFAIFPTVSDDGSIASYSWTLGDGRTSTDSFISTFYPDNGFYTITLTVTDNDGDTSSDSVLATVSNVAPDADLDLLATRIPPGVSRTFEASAFDPGEDDTLTYAWTFGDGGTATGQSVSHAWTTPGTYTITVRVSDGDGGSDPATARITVRGVVAAAGPDQQADEGDRVSLGSPATSADDPFTSFAWDFGDGATGTQRRTEHVYRDEGTYTAALTATDDGGSSTDAAVIVVSNVPPTITGIAASGQAGPGQPMSLKVFATDPGLDDELMASWDFGDGSTGTGIAVDHSYGSAGTYTVEVTVVDDDGGETSSTREVTVGPGRTGVPDSTGQDFWVDFDANSAIDDTTRLTLYITGLQATSGVVEIPGLGFVAPFTVGAGDITAVNVPTSAMLGTGETGVVEPRGIHVSAADDVVVYALNRTEFSTDGYLALPVDAVGTRYRAMSYGTTFGGSELSIVATRNNTTVAITPSTSVPGHPLGDTYSVELDLGDAYEIQTSEGGDLTGTVLTADAPISVFGAHRCADVPSGTAFCDHLVEQLPPVTNWGRHFVTGPLAGRSQDTLRVLADADNTGVTIASSEGTREITLDAGEVEEFLSGVPVTIDATEAVMVAQYSNGSGFDETVSDPFMAIVPPFEQFFTSYVVANPSAGFQDNFDNVVIPTSAIGSLRVDGNPVPAGQFAEIPGSTYSAASVRVEPGTHRLVADAPFGVTVYGFDVDDAYGFPGGSGGGAVASIADLSVAPASQVAIVGEEACVDLQVRNAGGDGLPGVRVDLIVTGAHPETSSVTTGPEGAATFCLAANSIGTDTLEATSGEQSTTAQISWQVTSSNEPPTADDQSVTLGEDSSASIELTGSDPDGDMLAFDLGTGPSNGDLTGAAPNLVYTPDPNFNGTDQFTFTVSDGMDQSQPATVSITVSAVNDPPTMVNPGPITVTGGDLVSVPVEARDPDGTEPTLSIEAGPAGLALVDDTVTWQTTAADAPGSYPVTLSASDGEETADVSFVITVVAADSGPEVELSATEVTVQYSDAIDAVEITVRDDDVPRPVLALTLDGLPDGLTGAPLQYDEATTAWHSTITGLAAVPAGEYPVNVTVTDDADRTTTASLVVTVIPETVDVTVATNLLRGGPVLDATGTARIGFRVAEEVDGSLSDDLPAASGITAATPVTLTATSTDGEVFTCVANVLTSDLPGVATGACTLSGLPVGVYELTMHVANEFFLGSGSSVLTVGPGSSSASAVCARGNVAVNDWRSIDFALAASLTDRFGVRGGLFLHGKNRGGWVVRSTALTAVDIADIGAGRDSADIAATGSLFRRHQWHHGHGHHGHDGPWPHGHHGSWPHGHHGSWPHWPSGATDRSGGTPHHDYGHRRSGHHHGGHGHRWWDQQDVTVRIYVEDGGWGRPSPDAIWIGVYDLGGSLLTQYSSRGTPPDDALAPAWGSIRVFHS